MHDRETEQEGGEYCCFLPGLTGELQLTSDVCTQKGVGKKREGVQKKSTLI